jgi:hypothetical protein
MALLVLVVLGLAWAVALLVPAMRRVRASRVSGVSDHLARLNALANRTNGHDAPRVVTAGTTLRAGSATPPIPRPTAPALAISSTVARRRQALLVLMTLAGFTLLLALWRGGTALWSTHLLADLLLGTYVWLLVRFRRRANVEHEPVAEVEREDADDEDLPTGRAVIRARRRHRARVLLAGAGAAALGSIVTLLATRL